MRLVRRDYLSFKNVNAFDKEPDLDIFDVRRLRYILVE